MSANEETLTRELAQKKEHIDALKQRVAEIKSLLDNHVELLNACKSLAPQYAADFEQLRLDRVNTLQRCRPDPEDY